MNQNKKYDVFISYSRKDSAIADEICSAFDKVGITYFIDRKAMGGTANYVIKIANEIDNSKIMLLLASANAYKSKYVRNELHYAFNHDVIVLPYALDDVQPPKDYEILLINANWHYINADPIIPELLTSISQLTGKDITNEIAEIAEPKEKPITPELTSKQESTSTTEQVSTSSVELTSEQESTRTSDSGITPRHTNKSWIWMLIAALVVIGLGIFAIYHYQHRSIEEVEGSRIDSIQYSQIQDSIAQPSNTDTNITTSTETKTNTTKQPAELLQEKVNKLSHKVEEKTSQPKEQSKSPKEIESKHNEVIPNTEIDSQALQQAWEILPDTLIEGGIKYRKDSVLMELEVIGMAVDTTSFVTATILEYITFDNASFPVKRIDIGAFYACKALKSITIPNSVTEIGAIAFAGCSSLNTVMFQGTVKQWQTIKQVTGKFFYSLPPATIIKCTDGDVVTRSQWASYDFQSGDLFYNITSNTTVEVTYMESHSKSKSKYSSLTNATIPQTVTHDGTTYSVTSIGKEAFYACEALKSITIPNSVISIGDWTFYGCRELTSVTISNSVIDIGSHAFYGCESLTSLAIPNSVMKIGNGAFYACESLKTILFDGTIEQWQAIKQGSASGHAFRSATIIKCTDGEIKLK